MALILFSTAFNLQRSGRFPLDPTAIVPPCCGRFFGRGDQPEQMLKAAPLAAFPLLSGTGSIAGPARDQQRQRVREASRRAPLLIAPHAWLAGDAALNGDYPTTVAQLDWVYALSPPARPAVVNALAAMVAFPPARSAVADGARDGRALWSNELAAKLVHDAADPGIIFRVVGSGPAGRGYDNVVINSLLQRGEYELAYLAWISGLPESALTSVNRIYDGEFRKLPGSPPFNWLITDSEVASVDIGGGRGLVISYFGDGPGRFAEQTVLLAPGAYRLLVRGNREGKEDGNLAYWSLTCAGGNAPLARIDLPIAPVPQTRAVRFVVPEKCPAQRLAMDGAPSSYPSAMNINVLGVSVVPTSVSP